MKTYNKIVLAASIFSLAGFLTISNFAFGEICSDGSQTFNNQPCPSPKSESITTSPADRSTEGTLMEFCPDGTLKPKGQCLTSSLSPTSAPAPSAPTPNPNVRPINTGADTGPEIGGRGGGSQGGGSQIIKLPNPLGQTNTFAELINRIVNWLLIISAPILALMIIIGAFQIMTGAGEPEKIIKGRHTITYAIIGYALLLISSGITTVIQNLLSGR